MAKNKEKLKKLFRSISIIYQNMTNLPLKYYNGESRDNWNVIEENETNAYEYIKKTRNKIKSIGV
jgi:hypothetical protein